MEKYTENLLYKIALTQINGVGDILARQLLECIGDEEAIFRSSLKDLMNVRNIASHLAKEILNPDVLRKAEQELNFVIRNNLQTFYFKDQDYPYRLKECADAPILLYYKGTGDLNAKKIVSIVGTRKSNNYGNDFCEQFISDLSILKSDLLIVSGLAYGIDIHAHSASLRHNVPTIGVIAHGLDRIYPSSHRDKAAEMVKNGGLLTEFVSKTEPDKFNFIRRNRIIAGLADATIVVQSDKKGGSLVTADIANSYDREVFAVPGRITDKESVGCNDLIQQNKAILLQSAESFLNFMQWGSVNKIEEKQQTLLFDLNNEEQVIYDILVESESLHIDIISQKTGIKTSILSSILFMMEMNGVLRACPGNSYELIK